MLKIAGPHGDKGERKKLSLVIAGEAASTSKNIRMKAGGFKMVIAGGRTGSRLTIAGRGGSSAMPLRLSIAGDRAAFASLISQTNDSAFFLVDSFGQQASFSGTTAATILLSQPANDAWMQLISNKLNFKQLSFVAPFGSKITLSP